MALSRYTTRLKRLFNDVLLLFMQPAKSWMIVARRGTKKSMFMNFLYPFLLLVCLSNFIGKIFGSGSGDESFYPATVRMFVIFVTYMCAYHFVVYVVDKISPNFAGDIADRRIAELLTGYSFVVMLALELCLGLFPNLRIIGWIAQFYTVKIVWDGAAVLLRIPEERRLGYTMIVSVMIIFVPIVFGLVVSQITAIF